ncbi:hypothetical protein ACFXTH_001324 [Malus domestica]
MTSSVARLSSLVRGFTYDRLVSRLGGRCGNQIGAIFLSMSLNSDGVFRESKRCLVQSGDDSSEETAAAVVTKKKRKKVGVRNGRAMNTTKHLWAGAIAAMVSRTFVAPLERLKLKYIVRGEQRHLFELVKTIAANQGLKGFWKGNLVNILRTAPFKAINFYAYDTYRKQLLCFSGNKKTTNFERFVAGAAAGIITATLCLPLDMEWQGWGTASPVPTMVTKIVEDLKAWEKDFDTQMSFGGSRGKLQGDFKVQEDRKHRKTYQALGVKRGPVLRILKGYVGIRIRHLSVRANWVIPSWKPVPDTMTGGLRSNVKRYTVKCLNLGGATMPETKSSSSLSDPRDADSGDKKPRDGSSLPETSLGDGKVPCLPMLTSTAKDLREASNAKQTSEGLLQKSKFETLDLEELHEKIEYLNGFAPAYRDHAPTDILLHPGDNGPAIPAHKLLLATRSKILNIPNTEGCSKAPTNQVDNITLPELNHEELKSLVDFLYNADLLEDQMNKHVFSLSVAATKYGIPYLGRFCVRHMLNSLSSTNALDALEVADACSYQALKDNVLDYIAKNMSDVVFSAQFEALALKNPKLSVQVSRASFKGEKEKSAINVKKNITQAGLRNCL